MNHKIVFYSVGSVLMVEAALLLLPMIISVIYDDGCLSAFLISIGITAIAGFFMWFICRSCSKNPSARDGLVIASLSWILLSAFGALPFCLGTCALSFTDAFFETMNGFTTTGATVLNDLESMANSLLFWRSLTHWVGGMGILVFVTAMTSANTKSLNILKAEMPGPTVDKLVPKSRNSAAILYILYTLLTIAQIIFLFAGGMSFFESVIHAFGTAGTGGFGVRADSYASYSPYLQWVTAIFMLLFGVNFNLYYLILVRRFRTAFSNTELRCYIGIVLVATAAITANIYSSCSGLGEALRLSAFQVSSIITTTGYSTCNFNMWPGFSKAVLFILMLLGGCAGSTAGGFKIVRVSTLAKAIVKEIKCVLNPRSVNVVRMNGKSVKPEMVNSTLGYFALYTFTLFAVFLLLSTDGFDLETTLSSAVACVSNVGSGMNLAGPAASFSIFSDFSTWVMSFAMLAGRLEIYPLLVFFMPGSWKPSHRSH